MADSQNSSFIPKSPVRSEVRAPSKRKLYILTYVSFVIFFGALLATATVFFLGYQQDRELALQADRLKQERGRFSESSLAEVRELHTRLNHANTLLNQHVTVVGVLNALEEVTLQSVVFTGMSLNKQEDGTYLLELTGETPQFNATLFQREILSSNPVLAGAIFSEVQYGTDETEEEEGNGVFEDGVTFMISKELTADDIPYVPTSAFNRVSETVPGIPNDIAEVVDDGFANDVVVGDSEETIIE